MYKSSTCFASLRVVPFKLKKVSVPVPTASMGNSLIAEYQPGSQFSSKEITSDDESEED